MNSVHDKARFLSPVNIESFNTSLLDNLTTAVVVLDHDNLVEEVLGWLP